MGLVKGRERRLTLQRDGLTIMTPGAWKPRDPALGLDVRIGRYGPQALAVAGTTLLTVPANRVWVVKSIELANVLAGSGRVRLDMQSSGSKMLEFHSIPSFETTTIPLAYPLLAGETLIGYNPDTNSTAIHATVYVYDMPRWYFDAFGGVRGFVQMSAGGAGGNEVKNMLATATRDTLITSFYAGAIEGNAVVRTPYFGPGPHKYFALPQGAWVTSDDPYHVLAGANITFANNAAGWCAVMVSGLNGIEF